MESLTQAHLTAGTHSLIEPNHRKTEEFFGLLGLQALLSYLDKNIDNKEYPQVDKIISGLFSWTLTVAHNKFSKLFSLDKILIDKGIFIEPELHPVIPK